MRPCLLLFAALLMAEYAVPHAPMAAAAADGGGLTADAASTTSERRQLAAPAVTAGVPLPPDWRSEVTNDTQAWVLKQAASPEGVVIFTTFKLVGHKEEADQAILDMLRNFAFHLQQQGLLQHTLILTTDEMSRDVARVAGLPVTWDRCFEWSYDGDRGRNKIFDASKHWWALRAIERGFKVLYLDSDNAVLGNPLPYFDPAWDLQGLADNRGRKQYPTGAALTRPCGIYVNVKEERQPTGTEVKAHWDATRDGTLGDSLIAAVPCQSTGLWLLQPTPMAVKFMQAMVQRLMWDAPWQWEQAMWNEAIVPFLWATRSSQQLRYRILPLEHFSNIKVLKFRNESGMPTDNLIVHAGSLHGSEKAKEFQRLGLWRPHEFVMHPSSMGGGVRGRRGFLQGLPLQPQGVEVPLGVVAAALAAVLWVRRRRAAAAGAGGLMSGSISPKKHHAGV